MSMSIKINEENYKKLCTLSGELRAKLHKPVSINDTINFLYNKRKLSELAGKWKMNDKEVEKFKDDLKRGWNKWKIKSV
jgi:predicted CopG family antitoxin